MFKLTLFLSLILAQFAPTTKTFTLPLKHVVGSLLWFESTKVVEITDILDLDIQLYVKMKTFAMRGDAQIARIDGVFGKPVEIYTDSGSGRHLAQWTMVLNALFHLRSTSIIAPQDDVIEFEWITIANNGGHVTVRFKVRRKRGESDKKFIERIIHRYEMWTKTFPPKVNK